MTVKAIPAWLQSGRVLIGLTIIFIRRALRAVFAPYLAPHDPSEQNLLAICCRRPGPRAATRRFRSAPTASAAACSRG